MTDLNINVVAHGPIDSRHILVFPDAHDWHEEARQDMAEHLLEHFRHTAAAFGEDLDKVMPLIVFGNMRIEPS